MGLLTYELHIGKSFSALLSSFAMTQARRRLQLSAMTKVTAGVCVDVRPMVLACVSGFMATTGRVTAVAGITGANQARVMATTATAPGS
jgi:hypothetical protein